jgi:uncharacterized repeat protein (TIGR03803 family)
MSKPALVSILVTLAAASLPAQAAHETVLYHFVTESGDYPQAGVVRDAAGNLYGTTFEGGAGNQGSVYKFDTSRVLTVLHRFTGGSDGGFPYAGVTLDKQGNLYGTASMGGDPDCKCGVVFKVDAPGTFSVLYSFKGGEDGSGPLAGVIHAKGGLYGTTAGGGPGTHGVVFQLSLAGKETILHGFTGDADGGAPNSGVVRDSKGNLYGTTNLGGSKNAGVVYELDESGFETVLHTFTNGADGGGPIAGVIRDADGNLYGTAPQGGSSGNGVVYKLDAAGKETVLYNFGGTTDGEAPQAGVVRDKQGNLYGVSNGGEYHCPRCDSASGVAFTLDTSGNFTPLYYFNGKTHGGSPNAVFYSAGKLYGTTRFDGLSGLGLIYELKLK